MRSIQILTTRSACECRYLAIHANSAGSELRGGFEEVFRHEPPLDLARGCLGQGIRDEKSLGHLEVPKTLLGDGQHISFGSLGPRLQHYGRHDLLAILLVRCCEGHCLCHGLAGQQSCIYLQRRDLFTAAVDELLQAACQSQVALSIKHALVASVEPAMGEGLFICLGIVVVARRDVLALDADLAHLTSRQLFPVRRQDSNLHVGPFAHGPWLVSPVLWQRVRGHLMGSLRHGIGLQHWCSKCLLQALQHRCCQGSTAAPDEAELHALMVFRLIGMREEDLVDGRHCRVPGRTVRFHIRPEHLRTELAGLWHDDVATAGKRSHQR
mmetsp:Transcript_14679/g.32233  ORF Transcript_14679/g.32233 Transcript_14679/m.32233 type:complete len:325 (-) Transcript_14679:714-1688(-)